MEELVWNNNSSMLPAESNPSTWDSGRSISFKFPAAFSTMTSTCELSIGDIDDSCILGIQQQSGIRSCPLQSNAIAHQHPLHQVNKIPYQQIPSFLDAIAAHSTPTGSRSATEIPSSSSALTDLLISKPVISQIFLHHTLACLQQGCSSSWNDLMQFCYYYDESQLRNLQFSIEALDLVLSSDNLIEKNDGMSATTTTEHNVSGNMESMVLPVSIPPQKSKSSNVSSTTQTRRSTTNFVENCQSTSQGSSDYINKKSKAKKSKAKIKMTTSKNDPQLGMQYNYSSTSSSSCLVFNDANPTGRELDAEAIASMKEMIYRAAAFRPVNTGAEVLENRKRKNVKISNDPRTAAARQRRESVSERIRILQRLVPGGSKMDTASILDEAVNYLKFLQNQVKALQSRGTNKNKADHNMQVNPMTELC